MFIVSTHPPVQDLEPCLSWITPISYRNQNSSSVAQSSQQYKLPPPAVCTLFDERILFEASDLNGVSHGPSDAGLVQPRQQYESTRAVGIVQLDKYDKAKHEYIQQ